MLGTMDLKLPIQDKTVFIMSFHFPCLVEIYSWKNFLSHLQMALVQAKTMDGRVHCSCCSWSVLKRLIHFISVQHHWNYGIIIYEFDARKYISWKKLLSKKDNFTERVPFCIDWFSPNIYYQNTSVQHQGGENQSTILHRCLASSLSIGHHIVLIRFPVVYSHLSV